MGKIRFHRHRRKGRRDGGDHVALRALLPNLITSLAACAGITSIVFATEGRWVMAFAALIVAGVCDGVDGRVARMLTTGSGIIFKGSGFYETDYKHQHASVDVPPKGEKPEAAKPSGDAAGKKSGGKSKD